LKPLESILGEHPFFSDLEPTHLKLLAECASEMRFEAGQVICRQGEEANSFYLIRQGRVILEAMGPQSGFIAIQTLDAGEVLGWSWLVPPHRWRFQGRAVEPARLLALDGRRLRDWCEENPDLGYKLLKRFVQIMAQRLEATRLLLVDMFGARV
jgi:CRP-like cAMP-binding protein